MQFYKDLKWGIIGLMLNCIASIYTYMYKWKYRIYNGICFAVNATDMSIAVRRCFLERRCISFVSFSGLSLTDSLSPLGNFTSSPGKRKRSLIFVRRVNILLRKATTNTPSSYHLHWYWQSTSSYNGCYEQWTLLSSTPHSNQEISFLSIQQKVEPNIVSSGSSFI